MLPLLELHTHWEILKPTIWLWRGVAQYSNIPMHFMNMCALVYKYEDSLNGRLWGKVIKGELTLHALTQQTGTTLQSNCHITSHTCTYIYLFFFQSSLTAAHNSFTNNDSLVGQVPCQWLTKPWLTFTINLKWRMCCSAKKLCTINSHWSHNHFLTNLDRKQNSGFTVPGQIMLCTQAAKPKKASGKIVQGYIIDIHNIVYILFFILTAGTITNQEMHMNFKN